MTILLSTTNEIAGFKVSKTIGVVYGEEVISTTMRDEITDWKTMFGGKDDRYRTLIVEVRTSAELRLIKEAEEVGADAIIGIKYTTNSLMNNSSEIMVYGTAVKLEKVNKHE